MNYEDEIFNFLTSKENYIALVKAKEHFPKVKKRLIETLWQKVFVGLKEHYDQSQMWLVRKDSNIENALSKVYIYPQNIEWVKSNDLPAYFIGWERLSKSDPYYGFWINEQSQEYSFQTIMEYCREHKKDIAPEMDDPEDGEWWPFWVGLEDLNFDKEETLTLILPHKLDDTVNRFVRNIINIEEKMSEHLPKISKMKK
jgi:hypothetical protein